MLLLKEVQTVRWSCGIQGGNSSGSVAPCSGLPPAFDCASGNLHSSRPQQAPKALTEQLSDIHASGPTEALCIDPVWNQQQLSTPTSRRVCAKIAAASPGSGSSSLSSGSSKAECRPDSLPDNCRQQPGPDQSHHSSSSAQTPFSAAAGKSPCCLHRASGSVSSSLPQAAHSGPLHQQQAERNGATSFRPPICRQESVLAHWKPRRSSSAAALSAEQLSSRLTAGAHRPCSTGGPACSTVLPVGHLASCPQLVTSCRCTCPCHAWQQPQRQPCTSAQQAEAASCVHGVSTTATAVSPSESNVCAAPQPWTQHSGPSRDMSMGWPSVSAAEAALTNPSWLPQHSKPTFMDRCWPGALPTKHEALQQPIPGEWKFHAHGDMFPPAQFSSGHESLEWHQKNPQNADIFSRPAAAPVSHDPWLQSQARYGWSPPSSLTRLASMPAPNSYGTCLPGQDHPWRWSSGTPLQDAAPEPPLPTSHEPYHRELGCPSYGTHAASCSCGMSHAQAAEAPTMAHAASATSITGHDPSEWGLDPQLSVPCLNQQDAGPSRAEPFQWAHSAAANELIAGLPAKEPVLSCTPCASHPARLPAIFGIPSPVGDSPTFPLLSLETPPPLSSWTPPPKVREPADV